MGQRTKIGCAQTLVDGSNRRQDQTDDRESDRSSFEFLHIITWATISLRFPDLSQTLGVWPAMALSSGREEALESEVVMLRERMRNVFGRRHQNRGRGGAAPVDLRLARAWASSSSSSAAAAAADPTRTRSPDGAFSEARIRQALESRIAFVKSQLSSKKLVPTTHAAESDGASRPGQGHGDVGEQGQEATERKMDNSMENFSGKGRVEENARSKSHSEEKNSDGDQSLPARTCNGRRTWSTKPLLLSPTPLDVSGHRKREEKVRKEDDEEEETKMEEQREGKEEREEEEEEEEEGAEDFRTEGNRRPIAGEDHEASMHQNESIQDTAKRAAAACDDHDGMRSSALGEAASCDVCTPTTCGIMWIAPRPSRDQTSAASLEARLAMALARLAECDEMLCEMKVARDQALAAAARSNSRSKSVERDNLSLVSELARCQAEEQRLTEEVEGLARELDASKQEHERHSRALEECVQSLQVQLQLAVEASGDQKALMGSMRMLRDLSSERERADVAERALAEAAVATGGLRATCDTLKSERSKVVKELEDARGEIARAAEESTRLIFESQRLEDMLVEAVARAQLAEERADDLAAERDRDRLGEVVSRLGHETGGGKASNAAPTAHSASGIALVGDAIENYAPRDQAQGALSAHFVRAAVCARKHVCGQSSAS